MEQNKIKDEKKILDYSVPKIQKRVNPINNSKITMEEEKKNNIISDEELEDPDFEENRRLENNLEKNMKIFESRKTYKMEEKSFLNPEEENELENQDFFVNKNIWELSSREKKLLIKYCYQIEKNHQEKKFNNELKNYKEFMENVEAQRFERDLNIIASNEIVGVTVSGCAKYSKFLEKLKAPITIIEEAAEVLETHTISVLTEHTQHLIMIGDHQQLKPHVSCYDLEKNYNFNISLFERLIKNGINFVSLKQQRRMRPEFADFIRLLYQDYEDHESVFKYENIRGVNTNLFFFNHNWPESENSGLKSKVNIIEAYMITFFSRYLTQQNYKQEQITILTMYVGQTLAIKQLLKEYYLNIRVATVDNYQGEENDIILVSLVRSNKERKLGFVSIENRVCVAFSRARKGLYLFGNFDLISKMKEFVLWQKILEKAKEKNVIGDSLNLACQNHGNSCLVQTPDDFMFAPEGGCKEICNIRKECGHIW